jgi:integral membrane protein
MSLTAAPSLRTLFRAAALTEAVSWAGLLVGMAFKHVISGDETGVHIFGPLHGAAFILYVVAAVAAARGFGWRRRTTLLALAASIPPLLTWAFERWAERTGRLSRAGVGR